MLGGHWSTSRVERVAVVSLGRFSHFLSGKKSRGECETDDSAIMVPAPVPDTD